MEGDLMNRKTILVKNLPPDASEELVTNYLEVISEAEVTSVRFPEVISNSCLVQVDQELSDAAINSIKERCGSKPLSGSILQIERPDISAGVLVRNITTHTEDLLYLYFENTTKSGGDTVKNVKVHADVGMAIVEFEQTGVVSRVLERSHTLSGVQLQLELYIQGFHQPWIEKLKEAKGRQLKHSPAGDAWAEPTVQSAVRSPRHGGSYDNTSSTYPDASQRSPDKPSPPATAPKPPASHVKSLSSRLEEHCDSYENVSSTAESPTAVLDNLKFRPNRPSLPPKPTDSHNSRIHEPSEPEGSVKAFSSSRLPHAFPEAMMTSKTIHRDHTFGVADESGDQSHRSQAFGSDHAQRLQFQVPAEDEMFGSGHIVREPSRVLACDPDHTLQSPERELNIPHSIDTAERQATLRETVPGPESYIPKETVTKEVPKPKLELLSLSGFQNRADLQCEISIEVEKGIIRFTGDADSLTKAQLTMYESEHRMCEVTLPIAHSTMASLLSTPQAKKYLGTTLKCDGAVTYVDKGNLTILALSEKQANQLRTSLKKVLLSEKVALKPGHQKFLNSTAWQSFISECHDSDQLVRIVTDIKHNAIWINGLNGDVTVTRREVEGKLRENAIMEKTLTFDGIKGRFIYLHFRHETAQINERLKSKSVNVLMMQSAKQTVEFTISGPVDEIEVGTKEVQSLEKKLEMCVIDIPHKLARSAPWCTFTTTPKFKEWIDSLEKKYQCCIQPNISRKAVKKPPPKKTSKAKSDLNRSRSTEALDVASRRSAFLPEEVIAQPSGPSSLKFGSTTVTVKSGDITKEQVDVLVNVADKSLNLNRGGISKIFLKAGGEVLQQSLQQSSATAPVASGTVIVTPGGGKLKCQKVCHLVLADYKDNSSMQELRASVQDILQKSSKYSSVSFPSLGCGNLKYPATNAAAVMLSEMQQFATSKSTSLNGVNIVIYDTKVLPIFQNELQKMSGGTPRKTSPGNFHRADTIATFEMPQPKERKRHKLVPVSTSKHGPETITIGNTKITLKEGDITKEKANVLVNVTNTDLDLSRGKVSESFLKAGGKQLQEEMEQHGAAEYGDVVVASSCGQLKTICGHIANAVLPRWRDATTLKFLSSAVQGCLTEADKVGAKSITFPTLGCGQLRYPADKVAQCMLQEIRNYVQTNSTNLKYITVVIFDVSLLAVFSDNLIHSEETVEHVVSDSLSGQSSSDEGSAHEIEEEDDTIVEYAETEEISSRVHTGSSRDHLQVVTRSGQGRTLKTKLTKEDLGNLFSQDTLDVNTFVSKKERGKKILESTKDHLNGIAKKHNIELTIDTKALELKFFGEQGDIHRADKRMTQVIMEEKEKLDDPEYAFKKGGNFNDYCEMKVRKTSRVPSYWSDDVTVMEGLTKAWRAITGKTKKKYRLVKAPTNIYKTVEKLVMSSWQQHLVGQGRDAAGIPPNSNIKVTSIEIVENLELFQKYFQNRQHYFYKVMRKEILPLTKVPLKSSTATAVMTDKHLSVELRKSQEPEVNEFFVFHGTRPDIVDTICSNGLDFRMSNEAGMLGKAVYAAESSTKADQYADDKTNRSTGKGLQMVLLRMTMGQIYACENPNPPKYTRPPCTTTGCMKHDCKQHTDFFDSIVFHSNKLFREFVVYSIEQCYPEFLIKYDRV